MMLPPLFSKRHIFDGDLTPQEYVVRAKAVAAKRKEDFDAFAKTVTWIDVVRYNRHQKAKGADRIRIKFPRKPRPQTSFMRRVPW